MATTLAATRAWKRTRPSVPRARRSRGTRARPRAAPPPTGRRAAVGRTELRGGLVLAGRLGAALGLPARRRSREELQQIPLDLAHTATDGRQLDRADGAGEVGEGLDDADDPPAQRAEHLPPVQGRLVDRPAAGRLVGGDQLLDGAEARRRAGANRSARPSRTTNRGPRGDPPGGPAPSRARPGCRRARRSGCRCGSRRAPPPAADRAAVGSRRASRSPSSKAGCGWPEPVELAAQLLERIAAGEAGDVGRRDAVDGGQDPAALRGQDRPERRPAPRRAGSGAGWSRPRRIP